MGGDNQNTILVKKADGTFVRVPLSSLKKKTNTTPPAEPVPTVNIPASITVSAPFVPEAKPEKLETEPVKPILPKLVPKFKAPPLPRPTVNNFTTDDSLSLLSEPEPTVAIPNKISNARKSQLENVLGSLSFSVPPTLQNRLRSIIQLRLKDVRGEVDTRDLVLRSPAEDGLGITPLQADELEIKCKKEIQSITKEAIEFTPPPRHQEVVLPMNQPPEMIQPFEEPPVPATTAPFNAFLHSEEDTIHALIKKKSSAIEHSQAKTPLSVPPPKSDRLFSTPVAHHPSVRDITAPVKEWNPVDEIRYFTLVDFRRLSSNATDAAVRLKQKFTNLREEATTLFLEAAVAWRQSPLYMSYLTVAALALSQKSTTARLSGVGQDIKIEEIRALINMEKELGI